MAATVTDVDLPTFATLLATLDDEHVLTVTLNRPDRLNAFNQPMLDDFVALWRYARLADDVRAIVLRANGDRAFCSGVDVQELYFRPDNPLFEDDPGLSLGPKQNRCYKPLVLAVHGIAAGGAFYWLNEADLVVASDDAQFFDPHVTFGMTSMFEPVGMLRRMPMQEVIRMVVMGNDERVSAATAQRIGLVGEVVSREELWPRAHALAAQIARKPPIAVQSSLKAIWESLDVRSGHAAAHGLQTVQLANPIGTAQVDRASQKGAGYTVR
jgi:enoyl-CoA hydratase/carnithine racemase